MREIKFRGKSVVTKEWIVGSLVNIGHECYIIGFDEMGLDGHHIRYESDRPVFTDQNTIGQFTGLTDKNGKDIYEGDIVTFTKEIINGVIFQEKGFVKYRPDYAMFVLQSDVGDEILSYCRRHIEVIGNVFDNEDLLED